VGFLGSRIAYDLQPLAIDASVAYRGLLLQRVRGLSVCLSVCLCLSVSLSPLRPIEASYSTKTAKRLLGEMDGDTYQVIEKAEEGQSRENQPSMKNKIYTMTLNVC